ncbi:hypothetical protein LCGC14_0303020 [marine sediment metagenome]|uniref:Uncharacterized protein n=1 Tax=marine sediment metagenome TaxID=412755 RepID=A0A0F9WB91_9ZZZZ
MLYLDHFRIWVRESLKDWIKRYDRPMVNTASALSEDDFLEFIEALTSTAYPVKIEKYDDSQESEDYIRFQQNGKVLSVAKKAIINEEDNNTYEWFDADDKAHDFYTNYNFSHWIGKIVQVDALDHYQINSSSLAELPKDEYTIISYFGQIVGHNNDHLILRAVYGSIHQKTEPDQEFPLGLSRLTKEMMFVVKSLITRIDVLEFGGWIYKNDHISSEFTFKVDMITEITEAGFIE